MAEMSIAEAARRWGLSPSNVRKKLAQGRIRHQRHVDAATGHTVVFILDEDPPALVERGALTAEQRAAWNKGKRKMAVDPKRRVR